MILLNYKSHVLFFTLSGKKISANLHKDCFKSRKGFLHFQMLFARYHQLSCDGFQQFSGLHISDKRFRFVSREKEKVLSTESRFLEEDVECRYF